MNVHFLWIVLVLFVLITYIRRSTYTVNTPAADKVANFTNIGNDFASIDSTVVASSDNTVAFDDLNLKMWSGTGLPSGVTPTNVWGYRKQLKKGGGGTVQYLTSDPTTKLTRQCSVIDTFTDAAGNRVSVPDYVIVKKSVADPRPCTTTVPSGQYVSAICTSTTDTQFASAPTCPSGQYLSGFSTGSSTSTGSAGTCTPCTTTVPSGKYVSAVCTSTTDTQFASATTTCPSGKTVTGFSSGSSTSTGSAGYCCTTTVPSGKYVSAVCTSTTDTQFATPIQCSTNNYLAGFSAGSATVKGNMGTCTTCSGAAQAPTGYYIAASCSNTLNTTYLPFKQCPPGQYTVHQSVGDGIWTLGYAGDCACSTPGYYNKNGTCTKCSNPATNQYVIAECGWATDTQFATTSCPNGVQDPGDWSYTANWLACK
jgi:hypothetical protein